MDAFAIDRSDGREDGEDWTENYEELPGSANISIILESTTKAGVGPRLHKHPYAETFIIQRGWATLRWALNNFEVMPDRFWSCLLTRRISSPQGLMAMKVSTSTQESGSSPNGWSRNSDTWLSQAHGASTAAAILSTRSGSAIASIIDDLAVGDGESQDRKGETL